MVQAWHNQDKLYIKYGTDRATVTTAGEYVTVGRERTVEVKITLSALTQTETILSDTTIIPTGARIQSVELITVTAGATGTAIDVGLAYRDTAGATTLTEIDYDGLLAAAPIAVFNSAGERTIYTAITTVPASATGTGALIGTTLTHNGYISASMTDATSFTAGEVIVKVTFFIP